MVSASRLSAGSVDQSSRGVDARVSGLDMPMLRASAVLTRPEVFGGSESPDSPGRFNRRDAEV